MMRTRAALWLVIVLVGGHFVQAAPGSGDATARFFGFTNVWTLHLTLTAAAWDALQPVGGGGPGRLDGDFPWSSCIFECGGETLAKVALRFKGNSSFNSSRGGHKLPFKIDFNRGEKGRAFMGLEKLSLNNNFNDATQFREVLAYDAYRRAGLPAPRTAFGRLYLTITGQRTNELLGLYTLAESVDDGFLKAHFATKKGLLLKPERLRSLDYLGDDWASYVGRYVPKTDAAAAETSRLIALTKLVARADDATLERELPARLDLENVLRYIAVTALLANYDSFVGNGHNYYLFQPAGGGKATFIPWDLNESFGGHPMAGSRRDQAELSVLRPHAAQNRLIERLLANPRWAQTYREHVSAALTNACDPRRWQADADRLARLVQETVSAESPVARWLFERVALGQTNAPPAELARMGRPPARGGFPGDGEAGGRRGPPMGRGRGFGPNPGSGPEEMPLADWIALRAQNVADELAGRRTGANPRVQLPGQGPGGPRGRGGPPPPW